MVRLDSVQQTGDDGVARLLAGYRPLPGVPDEMVGADGRPRRHWQPFLAMLAGLGPEEINRRFAAADRQLRESGVFYRVYDDPVGAERPWPLSHVPLILDGAEWRALATGLVERVQLIEAVLADAYGPARLIADGRLPASVVAGNPEFLRPLAGVPLRGDARLHLYAVDVGRGPDGRWWVLSDRTQAPSGAGYALENRLALSRAMPDVYRGLKIERLAGFFQSVQAALAGFNRNEDSRVCLLTPGPMNETYFEHAYLARYLGLLLVEGEDLTARDDGVFIRTVSGLKRVEVMLRRLDADFADPLELNARSRLGVPGLVQAVRDGHVVLANALGSGLVEARALMGFMPALARSLLGTELTVPNVATWWLGDRAAREDALAQFDAHVFAPAFPGGDGGDPVLGGELDPAARARLTASIAARGLDYVAQEAATLSTMPVWTGDRLTPRPFTLRVFLARNGDRWQAMPGGFVRIADAADARAVSLQSGSRTADAWVLSDRPVAETTLLPPPEQVAVRRATGSLPSRAADNLFWLARYFERAEATLRLVRALLNRATEAEEMFAPLFASAGRLLGAWGAVPGDIPPARALPLAAAALQRRDLPGALPSLVSGARAAASVIRDRFSPDAWRALTDLDHLVDAPIPAGPSESVLLDRVNAALRIISSFSGLAQENMSQLAGWRFLELGRRIERAIATCRFVRQFADPVAPDGALDMLLELADSQITYRSRYVRGAARAPVLDLVVLDPNNPRSIAFQLERIETHLAALPKRTSARLSRPERLAAQLATGMRIAEATRIDDAAVIAAEAELMRLSDAVATIYFTHRERAEAGAEEIG